MVLKIYGYHASTCTRRIALICNELNIPYEFVPIDIMKGEHKSAEFLQKQPFGQVPTVDDDGFTMFESRAVCRYLAAKSGSPLLPDKSDIKKFAQFETACSIESSNFDPFAVNLIYEARFKGVLGHGPPDEAVVKKLVATLEAKMAGYEAILSKQKYLGGDEITLADLFHLPYGHRVETTLGYDIFQTRPNVARWWNELCARPTWLSVRDGL